MLNIWGVILYLRLPWITAQAGIGGSSDRSQRFYFIKVSIFALMVIVYFWDCICMVYWIVCDIPPLRFDLGHHSAVLLHHWHHWPVHLRHRHQRKGQRRCIIPSLK